MEVRVYQSINLYYLNIPKSVYVASQQSNSAVAETRSPHRTYFPVLQYPRLTVFVCTYYLKTFIVKQFLINRIQAKTAIVSFFNFITIINAKYLGVFFYNNFSRSPIRVHDRDEMNRFASSGLILHC